MSVYECQACASEVKVQCGKAQCMLAPVKGKGFTGMVVIQRPCCDCVNPKPECKRLA